MILFWSLLVILTLIVFLLVVRPWQQKTLVMWSGLFVGMVMILPVSLYRHWGASEHVAKADILKTEIAQTKQQLLALGSRQKVINELEKRVNENPKKAKGWYLLAKLYLGSGEHSKALEAMKTARQLEPHNPLYKLGQAEVDMVSHHQLSSDDKKLLKEVLQDAPGNINALNLFALDALQQKHYQLAIRYWQRVLTQVPADSNDAELIRHMIRDARAQV